MPHNRIHNQRLAQRLRRDLLLAHQTDTLPGVAALPERPKALLRLQIFKQRTAPFLLLINSDLATRVRVRGWIAWRSLQVRRWISSAWPGESTLLLRASLLAPQASVQHGRIALRMVADRPTAQLLTRCGGAIYSSSLNRHGGVATTPTRSQQWRWHRFCWGNFCWISTATTQPASGKASALIDLHGRRAIRLR
ncbi:MAG: Sua5/YciO/YrdC/YwlC family protein [Mariprofundales bacterium]|nr:Sua5/YciO/YrdC/YwlC family protein [Mariprofundales bacterium]